MSKNKSRHVVSKGMSHVVGDRNTSLLQCTIPELMANTVGEHGSRDAIVFCDRDLRYSWQEFSDVIDAFAKGLLELGLKVGDRVGIWSPNRPEWLIVQFATARIGVILVTINPAYRAGELEHALRASGCSTLVMAKNFKTSNYIEIFEKLAPHIAQMDARHLRIASLPELRNVICMTDNAQDSVPAGMLKFSEVESLADFVSHESLDQISAGLSCDDPINIQFTSGTTGLPKGATLSHSNIVNNARFTVLTMNFTAEDSLCVPVPLYHCFGMVMSSLGCLTIGATMVFPGEVFDPSETIRAVAAERCTALYGVPTMFIAIIGLEDFHKFDISSLRTGIMAGAPCPIATMNQVVQDMHMDQVTIAYGMTETSPVSFQSNVNDPISKRVSTIGRVHPHAECKVIDESGDIVPAGEIGELCTRGYLVMKGYWGEEERTREAIDSDGWMHSGDLAVFDEEGFCNIVGRVKDMIIRGGENVYPREVEDYIYRFELVKDVQVFGIPDEKYGEVVCAWVIPKPGVSVSKQDIRKYCKGQIAHYKVPKHIRLVDELPLTISGKPQKFKMREAMLRELNLQE